MSNNWYLVELQGQTRVWLVPMFLRIKDAVRLRNQGRPLRRVGLAFVPHEPDGRFQLTLPEIMQTRIDITRSEKGLMESDLLGEIEEEIVWDDEDECVDEPDPTIN